MWRVKGGRSQRNETHQRGRPNIVSIDVQHSTVTPMNRARQPLSLRQMTKEYGGEQGRHRDGGISRGGDLARG